MAAYTNLSSSRLCFEFTYNCVFVAAFTVIIGTSLAWIVSMYEFPGVNMFKWLLILPMAIPTYVNGYIYSGLNETSGYYSTLWNTTLARPICL